MEGAKAETEVAARVRAARVRRGAMVEVYEEGYLQARVAYVSKLNRSLLRAEFVFVFTFVFPPT